MGAIHRLACQSYARHARRVALGAVITGCCVGFAGGALAAKPHPAAALPLAAPIALNVDASGAPRGILHSRLEIPVTPGPATFFFPKWIPGEHGPTGPINGMAGLTMSANSQRLEWRRDDVDMYAFHVNVPRGINRLVIEFDFMTPVETGQFSAGASTTEELALLSWNQMLLYPAGVAAREVRFAARLKLPADWRFGTALSVANQQGRDITFTPVSLETLVDSPVLCGAHFRTVALTSGGDPAIQIDMACDGEAGLAMAPEQLAGCQRLVAEADALFGARHFGHYHFLLTLSDHTAHFGLEHHESSDDRVAERSLIDDDLRTRMATLLPHEFVHSWNGKYRRPAGLATANYQEPMKGELLWVYEGLTQYLGYLLMTRSGLRTPDLAHDQLADVAAYLDQRPGRTWRPLRDTAIGAQLVFEAPDAGAEWRRAADFYNEGLLIWLDADVTIRQLTNGARSLDDFCKRFHGGASGAPRVLPYTFDDIVADLNAVAPHDWRQFLNDRLDSTSPHAPLGGIANGGWTLAWSDSVPALQKALEGANETCDVRYSIGLALTKDGAVVDVVPGKPAAQAGVAPGDKVIAVNGRKTSTKVLREGIRGTRDKHPLEILVQRGEYFSSHRLDYDGGERYPVLHRDPAKPDVLSNILTSQSAPMARR